MVHKGSILVKLAPCILVTEFTGVFIIAIIRRITLVSTTAAIITGVIYSLLLLLVASSFLGANLVHPGSVPNDWVPSEQENSIQKKRNGEKRFCTKCNKYKPLRAHHCKQCKRCILKMDHHCIWVNNCIGFRNHKFFILFIVYSSLAALYSLGLLIATIILSVVNPTISQVGFTGLELVVIIYGFLIAFPFSLTLTIFTRWHLYLISKNMTTIEYSSTGLTQDEYKKKGKPWRHIYDISIFENLKSVLGPNVFLWFIPIGNSLGDGLNFGISSYIPQQETQNDKNTNDDLENQGKAQKGIESLEDKPLIGIEKSTTITTETSL